MNGPFIKVALVSAGILGLTACATGPRNAGFGDVRQVVLDRTGQVIQWDRQSTDDQAVHQSVRAILAGKLTADQAVQIALLNNHNLQATFENLGIAQADLVQAGLLRNPVFDLGVRFPTTPPFKTYVDISVTEDFINVFFIPARRKLAEAQFERVKSQVTADVLTLAAETKSAFYTYQAAEQLVELRRSVSKAAAASADAALRIHDAGNSNDLDLIDAKAQDARAKVDLADADADADDARERLNDLMGLWGEETVWTIHNRLPELPTVEVHPLGLESLAIRRRPDLVAARQDIRVQALALGFTAQTRFLNEANLGPEGERETDGQWRIGPRLSVPIPIFDQGQAAVPRAQALVRQSEERYWALAVDVRSQVRAARTRMLNARRKAQFYRDQILPLEQQFLQQTQLQYNGMFVGVFQLLQARRDQIDAARQYIEALRDYWTARADLERAVGGQLPAAVPGPSSDATSQPDFPSHKHQSSGAMP
jgi:cobalt-zinc-cadmium efflux system outer membrane protein